MSNNNVAHYPEPCCACRERLRGLLQKAFNVTYSNGDPLDDVESLVFVLRQQRDAAWRELDRHGLAQGGKN